MKTQMRAMLDLGQGAQFQVRHVNGHTWLWFKNDGGDDLLTAHTYGTTSEVRDTLTRLRDALDAHLNAEADAAMADRAEESRA